MWTAVLLAGVGCYLLKLAGLSLPERVLAHPTVERVADLIPVALLAALVAAVAERLPWPHDDNMRLVALVGGAVVAAHTLPY